MSKRNSFVSMENQKHNICVKRTGRKSIVIKKKMIEKFCSSAKTISDRTQESRADQEFEKFILPNQTGQ